MGIHERDNKNNTIPERERDKKRDAMSALQ
jgi:hypothetical protein